MAMIDDNAIENKLSNLVAGLIVKTREGGVTWATTLADNQFIAGFSRFVVSVRQDFMYSEDEDSGAQPFIEVSLLNQNGRTIEATTSYAHGETFGPGISDDYEELLELFILARRSAHDVEESLDDLLQELESR